MNIEWCKLYGVERYLLELTDEKINLYSLLLQFQCETASKLYAFTECKMNTAKRLVAAVMAEYEDEE